MRGEDLDGDARAAFCGGQEDIAVFRRDDHRPNESAVAHVVNHPLPGGQGCDTNGPGDQEDHHQLAHTSTVTREAYGEAVAEPQLPKISAPADVERLLQTSLADAFDELGCFNLALFGKTGAGKSTLLNAIFGRDVAQTGLGQPVTKGLVYYRHDDGFLGVFDSEGFETGTSGDVILAGLRTLVHDRVDRPLDERIHAAWYVVRWSDRRFEDSQAAFVRALADLGLPVIMVMTQVPTRDGDLHPDAKALAEYIESLDLPLAPDGRVVLTNALADTFTNTPVFGLQTLLDDTYRVAPLAAQQALTAAQVVDLSRKKKAAAGVVRQSAAAAAVIGATPIPFTDAAFLIPTQVTMIARITAAYGLPRNSSRALAVAGSVVLTGGATLVGRSIASNLLKFVPGGVIAGSAISGTVAATLTTTVGKAWSKVCEFALGLPASEREQFLASSQVVDRFRGYLKGSTP